MNFLTILSKIKALFSILETSQRKRLYTLQILLIFSSIFEVIGIASIAPLMAIIGSPNSIANNQWLLLLYQMSGVETINQFLILLGFIAFLLMAFGTLISILTLWKLSFVSWEIGMELGDKLYELYLNQNWLFHVNDNSARFIKQIAHESSRMAVSVIYPFLYIISRSLVAIFLIFALAWVDPTLIIALILLLVSFYIVTFKIIKGKLITYGEKNSDSVNRRSQLMQEGFGGIKDILLLHKQPDFIDLFKVAGKQLSSSQAMIMVFSSTPRLVIELVIFSSIILTLIFLVLIANDNTNLIGTLGIFSVAGLKLLPAINQIYTNVTIIKGNLAAFHAIKADFNRCQPPTSPIDKQKLTPISFQNQLKLSNVSVYYPNKSQAALDGINITIPKNQTIGFVGPSGSGKSTAIDIFLGLIKPNDGQLLVDNQVIDNTDRITAWQSTISYVPQMIFLTDASIAANIAFSLDETSIDYERVNQAITMASLTRFIEALPQGIHTRAGERGTQLSGGQRQRIGIARALYQQTDIIFMDEATSALDNLTEQSIMRSIEHLTGTKTLIIVAHRLTTVKKCDLIYLFEKGNVIACGDYKTLLENNTLFQSMVDYDSFLKK